VFDGGFRENFPLVHFMETTGIKRVIGLFLTPPEKKRSFRASRTARYRDGWRRSHCTHRARREDRPNRSATQSARTDFDLTDLDKEFLLAAGRAAALRFVLSRGVDDAPDEAAVVTAETHAEDLRKQVATARGRALRPT